MSTISLLLRSGCAGVGFLAGGLLQANDIEWHSLSMPTSAAGGSTLQINAMVTNTGDDDWGENHYLAMRDASGNVVALESIDGISPGTTVTRIISLGLPDVTATSTFTFQALEHDCEYFGAIHTRTVSITATPPYQGVQLSTTTFDALAPAMISTTDSVKDNPPYRLRAKVIDGTYWGWHAANQWNLSGYPLDNPPPPGTYAICSLYWVRYTTLYGSVLQVGPERLVPISVSGSVALSSNWFHAGSPPRISTNENMTGTTYRLFATFRDDRGGEWETSSGINNNNTLLTGLPPPGTYQVTLFWRKYDGAQHVTATSSARTAPVIVTDGPILVLNGGGAISGTLVYHEEEETEDMEYSEDTHFLQVPVAGVLRVRSIDPSGRAMFINAYAADERPLQCGIPEVAVPVTPGVYSIRVTSDHATSYTVVGELFPYATTPVITSPATATGSVGTPFAGYTAIATGTAPISFDAPDPGIPHGLPPGLGINASTGVISGTPTSAGTYEIWLTAANGAGSVGKWVTIEVALPAPGNLRSTEVGPGFVALAWNAPVSGVAVDHYELSNGPGPLVFTEGNQTSFLWGGLSFLSNYTFQVRTVDPAGNRSAWTSLANVATTGAGVPSGSSRWIDLPRTDLRPGTTNDTITRPPDGIRDEVIGVDQNRFTVDIVQTTWDYPFHDFWTLWGVTWPDGTFTPNFTFALMMEPYWDYEAPLVTSVDVHLSFQSEPGQEYAVLRDDSAGHAFNPASVVQQSLPTSDSNALQHIYDSIESDQLQYAKFYLVRYGKPIGSVSGGGTAATVFGSSRGTGGTLSMPLPASGNVAISLKDTAGSLLKAGPNVLWEVWDGVNKIQFGTHALGDLLDLGINTSGQFQVGLRLDDSQTVWFNLEVRPAPTGNIVGPPRMWINDDNDSGATGGDDIPGSPSPNYADSGGDSGLVNGVRDLVDFFPVTLNLGEFLAAHPPGSGARYKLKHAGGAVNFVYTHLSPANAESYHRQLYDSGFGDNFTQAAGAATTHRVTAAGFELSTQFLNLIANGTGGVLLLEGRAESTQPLVLSIERSDGTVVAALQAPLKIYPVERMFRHLNLRTVAQNYNGSTNNPADPGRPDQMSDPGEPLPDSTTNMKYFVFVHGYNVDAERARGWQAEVFKRLYRMGSNARFVGVSWYGSTGLDYHEAVFNAFQTGDVLAARLNAGGVRGDVTVAAHSLGNMVVSHAIHYGGLAPARYYMINAAVPLEAYDNSDGNVPPAQRLAMTERKWKLAGTSTFAANWHDLFKSTSSDRRNDLTWKNRFSNALNVAHNFYSPGDDVVENPEWDTPSLIKIIMYQGFNLSRGAWVTQEFAKGANIVEFGGSLIFARVQGGWGQSVDFWPTDRPSPDQKTEPYFGYFLEHDLFHPDPVRASAKAVQKFVQYDLLARGIPALSYAAAVNSVPSLQTKGREFNMETQGRTILTDGQGNQQPIWPQEGHTSDDKSVGRWLHSDFKNVALPYVYPMYQEMINRGALP